MCFEPEFVMDSTLYWVRKILSLYCLDDYLYVYSEVPEEIEKWKRIYFGQNPFKDMFYINNPLKYKSLLLFDYLSSVMFNIFILLIYI